MDYGLIGGRLGHSYSKLIHERLADYAYELLPLNTDEFSAFMKRRNFKALNVTIPYKELVIPYLDELDSHAAAIGAVNTIVNQNGHLVGHNTDYDGFLYMMQQHGLTCEGRKVVVLGNGGASKAILAVAHDQHAREVIVVNRHTAPGVISYKECYTSHTDAEIIINTTPVGMYPNMDESPLLLDSFTNCEAVLDIIYNPIETKLTKAAAALGIPAITGLEMLIAQAVYGIEFFLEHKMDLACIPPVYEELSAKLREEV